MKDQSRPVKHSLLVDLEHRSQADLIAELQILSKLVFDGVELVQVGARVPSMAWENWARRARTALRHELVEKARRIP